MRKLSTTADNVGGITRLIAIPAVAFRCVTYNRLTEKRSLTLLSTDNCIEIECNRNEDASDESSASNEGLSYVHQVHGKIFGLDLERQLVLDTLLNGSWIVLATDGNGVHKLYGTVDVPLRFVYNSTSGSMKSVGSVVSYSFMSTQSKPALVIDSHPL